MSSPAAQPAVNAKPNYFNPTVAGTCEVLELLAQTSLPLSVSEIAANTSLTRGTALRVMRTLAEVGVAEDVEQAKYLPGARLISLGLSLRSLDSLLRVVRPFLERLTAETGETSHFGVLSGDKSLIADVCDCDNALRVASRPGTQAWIHAAATGKAILSVLPTDEQLGICQRIEYRKLTKNTLDSPESMIAHLKHVASHGYAVDDEEYFAGVRCLASPVALGRADAMRVGAIGITAATARFTRHRIPEFASVVCGIARELEEGLGTMSVQGA